MTACLLIVSAMAVSPLCAQIVLPINSTSSQDQYEESNDTFGSTEPSDISDDDYALIFADTSYIIPPVGRGVGVASTPVGQWYEIPYVPNQSLNLQLTNFESMPMTLSNVGFITSPTLIPLDSLNFSPPPSDTTPLPSLDGTLAAGASSAEVLLSTPEPSSLWLALLGGTFLLVIRARIRRTA